MAYIKTIWANDLPPSIDDINLEHIEEGIYQNSLRIDELIELTNTHTNQIDGILSDIDGINNDISGIRSDINVIQNDITTINNTKANKADVPTTSQFETELAKKVNLTTYNTFVNTTLPNTYYKKTETYTRTEIDNKDNTKLSKSGDTGSGNYTFTGTSTASRFISTQNYITMNGYRIFITSGQPSGTYRDVWIKNG